MTKDTGLRTKDLEIKISDLVLRNPFVLGYFGIRPLFDIHRIHAPDHLVTTPGRLHSISYSRLAPTKAVFPELS